MPIFAEHRLLFIHIPKNAGRSIEIALLNKGSPDGGRRSFTNRIAKGFVELTRPRFAQTHLIGTLDYTLCAQHMTYSEMELLGLLPSEKVNVGDFHSFCVCRNPFDRVVSSVTHFGGLTHLQKPVAPDDFEKALDEWLNRPLTDHNERAHRRPQIDYLLDIRGRQAVQTVLRYETLGDDFKDFMNDRGFESEDLPWHGRSSRSRHYRDYFTANARKSVEREFEEDLDAFGYSF